MFEDVDEAHETTRAFRRLLLPRLGRLAAATCALAWMGLLPWQAGGFMSAASAGCLALAADEERRLRRQRRNDGGRSGYGLSAAKR